MIIDLAPRPTMTPSLTTTAPTGGLGQVRFCTPWARDRAAETVKDARQFDQERFASISAKMAKELARTRAAKRWKKLKSLDK